MVEKGGKLILESGAVIKNHVRSINGGTEGAGGVDVYGELTMEDGAEISGNRVTSSYQFGAGVHVGDGGKFTMNGGTIKGNENSGGENGDAAGGGVYVAGGGTFRKSGGVIYGRNEGANTNDAGGIGDAVSDDGREENNTLNEGHYWNWSPPSP